ncbi:IS1595 family transposase [Brevundimonas albigilva]|uniref:IS1595 family transposase n=1 Tax=Brevundimonas albigilva TaxID=1312364 RepID=A0ABY4SRG4_9CAUL|nr:IS1595 family transposase [Brevundimonas albigilva]UQV18257.1 IS1595 family transposase [Brevundimonas albigilva]URI16889.1 IS1595 family transposase [Brevundimonas albigilva]
MSVLSKPYFHDEAAAFAYVEGIIWGSEPTCPHCGVVGRAYALKNVRSKPSKKNPEGVVRHGLKKCGACRGQFTVRKGTIFEESHLEMHKWLQAIYLMCASKKGISALQLQRTLEVQYNTAWFLAHRIREAMRSGDLAPFGQGGGAVEVDETYIGREPGKPVKRAFHHKMKVLSLVDRSTGQVRSVVVDNIRPATIAPIVLDNLHREARLMTDEAGHYLAVGRQFAEHGMVRHGQDEYVSTDDRTIHTNTIEGYFSIFKRGMKGVYQHCSKKHLHRYLAEFDFRYSNRSATGCEDQERALRAVLGGVGKRLTYRRTDIRAATAA